jgi:molybdenum cofactor sulfurtransferase
VLQPDGKPVSYSKVERAAAEAGIDLRSGCMCNPGACYEALGLKAAEVQSLAGKKAGCGDEMDFITVLRPAGAAEAGMGEVGEQGAASGELVPVDLPLGSLRASFGWASTFEDCYALVKFIKDTYVQ